MARPGRFPSCCGSTPGVPGTRSQGRLQDRRTRVTYRNPERRTGQPARHLTGLGVARGERVTILPRNRTEATESLPAATQAGGIGVPPTGSTPGQHNHPDVP
ncbi:AMP-binding protein [Streptomyces sp. NPDC004376]